VTVHSVQKARQTYKSRGRSKKGFESNLGETAVQGKGEGRAVEGGQKEVPGRKEKVLFTKEGTSSSTREKGS